MDTCMCPIPIRWMGERRVTDNLVNKGPEEVES